MGWFDRWSGDPSEACLAERRDAMVDRQIRARGVRDPRVLDAVRQVPRHRFVPQDLIHEAYEDRPLGIGHGQTISQPYIVAAMTELCQIEPDDRVLEVGTGCGYQTAVLAQLAKDVYSVERVAALADLARRNLAPLGLRNVTLRHGDGFGGWPEAEPFDAILVTAAPPDVPQRLRQALTDGGRLVIPVGGTEQELRVIRREGAHWHEQTAMAVRFVPMLRGTPSPSGEAP